MKRLLSVLVLAAFLLSGSCWADELFVTKLSASQLRQRIAESIEAGLEPVLCAARYRSLQHTMAKWDRFTRSQNTLLMTVTPILVIPEEEEPLVLGNAQ